MAKDLYQFRTKEEEEEALMDMAIIRRHKSQTSGQGPSMALCVQTFKHHGAFSRYTPLNKSYLSMPELPQIGQPTIVEGMDVEDQRAFYEYTCSRCFHDYQMQQMEQDGKKGLKGVNQHQQ